jgi:D-glycero-D-manno-heptose 1,7-bisphosphate phosphatase
MTNLRYSAVFLDRDGTLNVDKGHVYKKSDWEWIPGAQNAILRLNQAGFLVVVVTNQSGIARGLYSESEVRDLHEYVNQDLARMDARIDAFYVCPHHPDFTPHTKCGCRKPLPGMLKMASQKLYLETTQSWMVGDKVTDVQAGAEVGARGILLTSVHGGELLGSEPAGTIIRGDLAGAVDYILACVQ